MNLLVMILMQITDEIMKIINYPEVNRVDSFANGNVDLIELYVSETNPLVGESLYAIHQKYNIIHF